MKTKTILSVLIGVLIQLNLHAQATIIGPEYLCVGECGYYQVIDDDGNQIIEDFTWDMGNGESYTGPTVDWCPWSIGFTIISVYNVTGEIVAQFQFYGTECCGIPYMDGPSELCLGSCGYYYINGGSGQNYIEVSDGSIIFNGEWCPGGEGVYTLIATDDFGCTSTMDVSVFDIQTPEIYTQSGAFCLDDVNSNCDRVCENTSVTYTTEVNYPGVDIIWSVFGAESWEANGDEVTVEWGDPGQGFVTVDVSAGGVSAGPSWFLSCGSYMDDHISVSLGTGIFTIDGPPGVYSAQVVFPDNSIVNYTNAGNGQTTFVNNLPAGSYDLIVTDAQGISTSCIFVIDVCNVSCPEFGVTLDVTPASNNDCCDASIEPEIIGNTSAPFSYLWSTGETTASINFLCEGFYFLTIVDDEGNEATSSVSIHCATQSGCYANNGLCVDILEVPNAAFETNPPANNGIVEICQGQTMFFDNQTNGSFNYTWDFGDGVSSSLVDTEHTYLSAGTYEAILIARNDCFCGDSTSVTIIVEETISPEIDCAGTICPGEEITYTTDVDCTIFNWNISDNGTIISGGSTGDNFITVDWGAGPEGIIELSVDGCSGASCVQTLFESIPIIDDNAEIVGPERVCKGAEVIYSMPAFAGTEFIWSVTSFGTITEGQGTNEVTIQWNNEVTPITQQVMVVYESCYLGCGGSDEIDVHILNEVFIEGPIEACPNEAATYTCETPIGGIVIADWTVYNAIGTLVASSASATPAYTIDWNLGSGTYIVHAEVQNPSNYCIDNFSVFVEVVQPTSPPNSITGILDICPGTSYSYSANSGAGSFDYTWYVSDGATNYILNGKTVNIIWGASPPYLLELTQTNLEGLSCESGSISASPDVINAVSLAGSDEVCHEATGIYTASFHENLEYNWQIVPADAGSVVAGDLTNETEIQWNTPGNHEVLVSVCGVSTNFEVTVHALPSPMPIYNSVCPGQTGLVSLPQVYNDYEWRNESGTTVSTGATANLGTGYYEVIVTDANGCVGNETFFIGTYGQPDVTISTPDFGNFCAVGGSMTLYALETSSGPLDYQWYFNGSPFGANSSAQVITQEGTYYVLVSDINGCTDFSNTLTLACSSLPGSPNPGCIPNGLPIFDISPGTFCNESQYFDNSINSVPNTWSWEFWDIVGGGISYSNLENPTHTWTNAGFNLVVFEVGIMSTTPGDVCLMNTYRFDTIPLVADFVFEGICIDELVSFTDISTFIPQTNITSWYWDFGDPSSGLDNNSNAQNPMHAYAASGFYTVTLTVTDFSNCISQKQLTVEIVDPPLSSFSIPEQTCEGAALLFEASGSFTDISWDFGDPASGTANNSNSNDSYHVFTAPGLYDVTLYVENVYGCAQTVSQQVNVEANGLTGIINVNPGTEVCEGDSVILTAPLADSYSWSTGALTQAITVFDAGEYQVSIYDAIGCGYTPPSVVIDLIPLPQGQITAVEYNEFGQPIDYFYNNYETCYGEDVYLEITEDIDYTYNWSDGSTGTEVSFTEDKENLLEVGTHIFTVIITDTNTGCTNVVGPFTVTVHPIPENIIITSMPSAPVCENTPTVMTVANPDPSYTYIWNTGQVGTTINTFYAGTYFVRATNVFGCEGESNTLEIVPGPNLDLIPSGCHTRCNPDTICLPPVMGIASFQWYLNGSPIPAPEGNDPDYIATESGEYYVEMVSVDGCVSISDILTLDLYDGFGSVQGTVYFDINNNGIIDAADTLMSGIGIILQENGINIDTLNSNQIGSISFSNILSANYELLVDELNLPEGMLAIISQGSAELFGCDDEDAVEFLIQFVCPDITATLTLEACPDETADYNGTDLEIGETQTFVFTTPLGCDSTVTVTVDALDESAHAISMEACAGSMVNYNGTDVLAGTSMDFVFENAVGCDSIVTLTVIENTPDSMSIELMTCEGTTTDYNGTPLPSGTQMDFSFVNEEGCDSIVTVIVSPWETYTMTEGLEACIGESINYNGTDLLAGSTTVFNYNTIHNCDSTVTVTVAELEESAGSVQLQACENSSVNYNGTNLLPGSVTAFTYPNSIGCDSIVTVTVLETDQDSMSIQLMTCEGTTVDYNGTTLAPGTQMDFSFVNAADCDSIVTVIVGALENYSMTENLEACIGEMLDYNGTEILAGSTNIFDYTTTDGCDSTVTVIVGELIGSTENIQLEACENSTVDYNGTTLLPGSTTDFTFDNINGCDSVITVFVDILLESSSTLNLEACTGSTIDFNGNNLEAGTSTDFMFSNVAGCDSMVTVVVAELLGDTEDLQLEACENNTINYNGTELLAGSTTDFTFDNAAGCDSIVTVFVAELIGNTENLQLEACENGTIDYNGTALLPGSTTDFTFDNVLGCDSVVTVFVESLLTSTATLSMEACNGGDVVYDGVTIEAGMSMNFSYTNAVGCDSIVTVNVAALPLYNYDLELLACENGTVEYNDEDLEAGSISQFVFTSIGGCDSTMTVSVGTLQTSASALNVSACEGDTYPYQGEDLPSGSSTDFTFTNAVGCDSTVTVNVATYNTTESSIELFVCPDATVVYNGTELAEGTDTPIVLTDQNGCDSVVTVSVIAYPDFEFEVFTEPTCWNENNGAILIENLIGGTAPFEYSLDGINYQDSINFENLREGIYTISVIDANDCEQALETELIEISPLDIFANVPEVPCDFSPVRLELENLSENAGTIAYSWENGSTQSFINVDTAGLYTVQISNACETIEKQYTVFFSSRYTRKLFLCSQSFFSK